MAAPPPVRVLLAGVDEAGATRLRTELGDRAEVRPLPPGGTVPADEAAGPTLLVIGAGVPAPADLLGMLRDRTEGLGVILVTGPDDGRGLPTLALLAPTAHITRVPADQPADLPRAARSLLDRLTLRHAYRATRAAAQRQLLLGNEPTRQPGERLFGPLHHQALLGAVAVDDAARLIGWNRRAAEILSLRPDAVGAGFLPLFPRQAREELREHLSRAAHSPTAPELFDRTAGDGAPQILRLGAQSVTDPEGTAHTLVLLEDVSRATETRRRLAERTAHALLGGDVAAAMTSGGSLRQRLQRSARAVVDRLDIALARIWLHDPVGNTLTPEIAAGPRARFPDDSPLGPGDLEAEFVAATRKPHLTNSVIDDPRTTDRQWARREGMVAFAGYPLITDGELMGVMALFARRALSGTTREALAGIADQIAGGVRQDRLLSRLHTTARALQAPLLPPDLPRLPGLDIAARYRAQGDSLDIGGDFYDVFPLPDGRWVLVLGDVCGKGPAAAAVTGLVRHTVWTAAQQDPDPSRVLPIVHRALCRENSPFCTLVQAVLEPSAPSDRPDGPPGRSVRVRIASAGHPAPLLRRRDGGTRLLEEHGPLLGAFDLTELPVHTTVLHPGDSLVLYTDGFTEGSGPHLNREPEDLAKLVDSRPGPEGDRPAEQLADLLFTDALTRWGDGLRDDLALVAVTARP
ncbi:SpoIIE family protein phosphatase [Streptomyces alkaliphilus]|uniref:SpoIIE family protein phosphatase n=1 Tax=Streptomyces alkaliphilus TaxID=1472722 RepID=A0A7W3TBU6_9ACTN|nr:SpoIIE family protein phosphatase [Streptomyces alkaliphilus]MBB0243892.1 SpoIIE family protein phosphatase [Streptomyces alkaliphilus]